MTSQQFIDGQRHDRLQDEGPKLPHAVPEQDPEYHDDEITPSQRMLSATTGSLITSLLVTPLDVVRVRLQSQIKAPSTISALQSVPTSPTPPNPSVRFTAISNLGVTSCCREVFWANNVAPACCATPTAVGVGALQVPSHTTQISAVNCAVDETRRKAFTSTWDGLQKIARNEGLTSLWRGLSPTLVMAVPANVIYFSGYDTLRYSQHSPIQQNIPDNYAPLAAGAIARVAAAMVVSPIEMFRTRMQAAGGGQKGIIQQTMMGMKELVSAQGYTSLWRGLTLTMWRDVPFSGVYWWGYETLRNRFTDARQTARGRLRDDLATTRARNQSRNEEGHTAILVDSFAAGAISGAAASILTMPFDVGKTRQQVIVHSADHKGAAKAAKELLPEDMYMPRFLLHIYREDGIAGLFRGWVPRTMKVAPACAIMISSYEIGKKLARTTNEKRRLDG